MRKISLIISIMVFLPIMLLIGQWQAMGPPGGNFRAMARAPTDDAIIYLATNNSPSSIWKTTDAGNSWNRVGSVNDNVYSLAVDPTNSNIVYAGGVNYMSRSTNGGVTWTTQTLPSYHWYLYETRVHPTTPTTIMASCYIYINNNYHMGFLKSTNSGISWSSETLSVDDTYSYSYCLSIDPTNPNNVYVGGYRYVSGAYTPAVYKSTDGGNNFSLTGVIPNSAYYCYSVAVHQTNSNYVYAGTLYGVYRSTDAGTSWTQVSTGNYNYSLTTTPANPSLFYSGGYGIIYRSTDAGANWTSLNTGLSGTLFYNVAASKTTATQVCAANNNDFYRSTNTGTNWERAHNGLNASPITAMINAPSLQSKVYVDNAGNSQYVSTNNAGTWSSLTQPLSCGLLCDFAVAYDNPNLVLEFEGSG